MKPEDEGLRKLNKRAIENQRLLEMIKHHYNRSKRTYGLKKSRKDLFENVA